MKNLLLLMSLFMISISSMKAQTYYVSTTGDDGNPGSIDQPWETIQYAMDVATPGSTVNIMGGTYNERVYLNVSGNAGNMITFQNYNNESVVVDGDGWNDPALCEIYDQQYVRIKGIHFTNNAQLDAMGIFIEGQCRNIEIIECTISEIHFSANPNAPVNENTNAQPLIVYGSDPNFAITDLLILDWRLPGFTPAGGLSQLQQYAPDLIIIALSGRPEVGADAHAAGVHAFISKIDPPRTLLDTIQRLTRPGQPGSQNYLSVNQP